MELRACHVVANFRSVERQDWKFRPDLQDADEKGRRCRKWSLSSATKFSHLLLFAQKQTDLDASLCFIALMFLRVSCSAWGPKPHLSYRWLVHYFVWFQEIFFFFFSFSVHWNSQCPEIQIKLSSTNLAKHHQQLEWRGYEGCLPCSVPCRLQWNS